MKPLALAVAALLLSLGVAAPAQAKLRICNKTDIAALVALGRFDGKDWLSEGWWRVPPKSCADIVQGSLTSRYYYLRGVQEGVDGAWDSNRFSFCIARDNFTIKGRKECRERGYTPAGFFEIDTGDFPSWTHNLSD
jgi:uncharacterized membrane protein